MFDFLNDILGFYSNLGIAWIVTVATDIVVNKYLLRLSPMAPEFRRGMLHDINPVGFVSVLAAGGLSVAAFFGGLGSGLQPYSPMIAVVLSVLLPPVLAIATRGRFYLRRTDDGIREDPFDVHGNPSAAELDCQACGDVFERPTWWPRPPATGRDAREAPTRDGVGASRHTAEPRDQACLIAETSSSSWILSETRTPPVSSAALKEMPKSLRTMVVEPSKPMRWLP